MRSLLSFEKSDSCDFQNAVNGIELESPARSLRQWDIIRCPICMEPPHNGLLLRCSSYEKGCRAYICDTSPRHSNCLDQFSKLSGEMMSLSVTTVSTPEEILEPGSKYSASCCVEQSKLLQCPLCRGRVREVFKVWKVREFLNSKVRSCSNETCEFVGTYRELRKHARREHPEVFPRGVEVERQREWELLEEQGNREDVVSASANAAEGMVEVVIDFNQFKDVLDRWFLDKYLQLETRVRVFAENERRGGRASTFTRRGNQRTNRRPRPYNWQRPY